MAQAQPGMPSSRILETLLVRRTNRYTTEHPIDIGFLCEAMLFYQRVVVLADRVVIKQLIRQIGIDTLLALVDIGALKIHYCSKQLGLMGGPDGKKDHYTPLRFQIVSNLHDELQKSIFEQVPKLGRSRRLSQRLAAAMPMVDNSLLVEPSFRDAIKDRDYLKRSFTELLRFNLRTDNVSDFDFHLAVENDTVVFRSTLDYDRLNTVFHQYVPRSHSSLSDSLLLCDLLEIQSDIHFAAEYESEIATDPRNQLLYRAELERKLARFMTSQQQLEYFHETIFPDSRDIRAAINSGARKVDELLPLLEKAQRFRSWLKERPGDVPLVADYFRATTEKTWIESMPGKVTRWAAFVCLGEVIAPGGGVAGAALSAVDALCLDKLLKRWTPNQFINGEYKRFLINKD